MERLRVGRLVVGALVAVAMVAGCGGGSTGSVPPAMTPNIAHHATSSSGDLLYVTNGVMVNSYTYPGGALVGSFYLPSTPTGSMCSDTTGNVFITTKGGVWAYHHGDTNPYETLSGVGGYPVQCSTDPTTGNLAVSYTETRTSGSMGEVAIFQNAQGTPTVFSVNQFKEAGGCAYDSDGNLFVEGVSNGAVALSELPNGSSAFATLTLDKAFKSADIGDLQWTGTYLAFKLALQRKLYHITISGTTATVTGKTVAKNIHLTYSDDWTIQGSTLVAAAKPHDKYISYYNWPGGGEPYHSFKAPDRWFLLMLTVSVAPTRK